MNDISLLIKILFDLKKAKQLKKYIDFIQFPFYRNIELNTRINFDFPLTVFTGQNGCGKSSCLHALYGMPQGKTPYEFWFDTKVDPILYYDDQRKRHSFWYSFIDEKGRTKEVIKARIKRGNDPNYWETSRPLSWAGMRKRKDKNERDKPIIKDVIYIDFRSELSAFDKFFYFGNTKGLRSRNKQDYIRRKSSQLKNIILNTNGFFDLNSNKKGYSSRKITDKELNAISCILGKKYKSALYIEHALFRNEGFSVIFNANHAEYSEAYAGSGEVAVVRLVISILNANKYSLILLDEPEVSLHPGAQERLKLFLLEQIKLKKHQVILTSHSPTIVNGLPKEAVKVFYQNPSTGRFLVKEKQIPEEAFYHLEYDISLKRVIHVEDILAKSILLAVLESMGQETTNLFRITVNPGGVSVIKKEFATIFCRELLSNNYIIFDGDQKPSIEYIDWRDLSNSTLSVETLRKKIKVMTGEDIKFSIDGGAKGSNHGQELELLKQYLDYYKNNVFYLPKNIPEEIIWNQDKAEHLLKLSITDTSKRREILNYISNEPAFKNKFLKLTEVLMGESNSGNIFSVQKMFIQFWIETGNVELIKIKEILNKIKSN